MDVLLTNDDGIDAGGLRAVRDALEPIADVTVVAPAVDQSAVGRQLSGQVDLERRDGGYAVHGTPADCVIATLGALKFEPDLVIAGCNRGANLGQYVLGRSGTVSAAVEATFFDVPAIAVSLYVPGDEIDFETVTPDRGHYANATRATRYLVEHAAGAGVFDTAEYLNVNAPIAMDGEVSASLEITRPSTVYRMTAEREGDTVHINDRIWALMAADDAPDPPGTDRRAVIEGRVSVSPLIAPHTVEHHEALDALAETYPESGSESE
jgi:5'-nucleotidase